MNSPAPQASTPIPDGGDRTPARDEWVITTTNGLPTRIEHIDPITKERRELSAEEYSAWSASYYTAYYMGVRDYAMAIAAGNQSAAQAQYYCMVEYLKAVGQM